MSLRLLNWNDTRGIGSPTEGVDHDRHHLDVVVEGQLVAAHDVDVGLRELPVAPLLRPLAAPGGLHLEAPERELQVAGVLEDVAREGHREVEVEPPAGVVVGVVGLQPAQDVDLLVDLAALGESFQGLDDAGLDVREAVQLEGARERGDDLALDDAVGWQQLGEPAQRADLGGHAGVTVPRLAGPAAPESASLRSSSRKGLAARSRPMVVWSPCPGSTTMSSASGSTFSARLRSIVGWSPPGRSVRPIEPLKSRSPREHHLGDLGLVVVRRRKVTEPSVWPGVWSTTNRSPASSSVWRSASSRDVVGLGHE
jgi:hypothetical protein